MSVVRLDATVSGGDAVAGALQALGVTTVFGIVSIHNVPTLDAIARSGTIEFICARHEQGAVHAADGYARTTGGIGVALTSTGPGAANAMGGLYEAAYASSPVLMITGQSETAEFGRGRATIHQAEQQLAMLRTVTKRAEHIGHADEIAPTILDVAATMLSGRRGPGAIEIPIDLQYAPTSVAAAEPRPLLVWSPDPSAVAGAVELLAGAVRPLIIAGGGVIASEASAELTQLAERLGAPVLTTIEGRGAIDERHTLALGPNLDLVAMHPICAEADVVLAIGTRFQQTSNSLTWLTFSGSLVHVDIDATVIGRVHRPAQAVVGDARRTLEDVLAGLPAGPGAGSDWADRCRQRRDEVVADTRASIGGDLTAILDAMERIVPPGAVVAKDATIAAYLWANRLLPVTTPRTALRPAGQGIGPGLPFGIGAAVATRRTTVVVQGDGGLMLSIGELATAAQYDLPLIVCVFNDGGYGMLKVIQDLAMGGRRTGVDLSTPDFALLATSYGMRSATVTSPAAFDSALSNAVDAGGPWLLDIDLRAMEPMRIVPQRRPSDSSR